MTPEIIQAHRVLEPSNAKYRGADVWPFGHIKGGEDQLERNEAVYKKPWKEVGDEYPSFWSFEAKAYHLFYLPDIRWK